MYRSWEAWRLEIPCLYHTEPPFLLHEEWVRGLGRCLHPGARAKAGPQGPWLLLQAQLNSRPVHHQGNWWVGPYGNLGYLALDHQ